MYPRSTHLVIAMASGFCFLLIDQLAKLFAWHSPQKNFYVLEPILGWEFFLNPGVAFGLPIPNSLTIIFTPIILLGVALFLFKKYQNLKTLPLVLYGLSFILFGALSNFIDRVLFFGTIDYLRIMYSVINLADVVILIGVLFLLISEKKTLT